MKMESTNSDLIEKNVEIKPNAREERRNMRMVTEGMAFILANLRNQQSESEGKASHASENGSILLKKAKIDENSTDIFEQKRGKIDYNDFRNLKTLHIERTSFKNGIAFNFSPKILHNNYLKGCKWSNCGHYLLTSSEDRKTRVFRYYEDNEKKLQLQNIVPHGDLIYDFCWHPKMDYYATTVRDHPVHLWDINGNIVSTFRSINHLDELVTAYSICISLDGQKLYSGFRKCIRIFDINRPGKDCQTIPTFVPGVDGQKSIISCLAMNPKMPGIYAAGTYGKTIGLYSDKTASLDCLFSCQTTGITYMKFSSDGNFLFTGGRKDSQIVCWDLRFPGQILCYFQRKMETNQRIYFDIDCFDRYLISGSSNGELLIWDLTKMCQNVGNNCELLKRINAGDSAINGVCYFSFHPFSPILATSSGQRVFPLPLLSDGENSDDDSHYEKVDVQDKLDNCLKLWSTSIHR